MEMDLKNHSQNKVSTPQDDNQILLDKIRVELVQCNLLRHNSSIVDYNMKVINNIVFGDKKSIVCRFKDFLLLDEGSDFLRRYIPTIILDSTKSLSLQIGSKNIAIYTVRSI